MALTDDELRALIEEGELTASEPGGMDWCRYREAAGDHLLDLAREAQRLRAIVARLNPCAVCGGARVVEDKTCRECNGGGSGAYWDGVYDAEFRVSAALGVSLVAARAVWQQVSDAVAERDKFEHQLDDARRLLGAVLRCEDVHTDEDWMEDAKALVEGFADREGPAAPPNPEPDVWPGDPGWKEDPPSTT